MQPATGVLKFYPHPNLSLTVARHVRNLSKPIVEHIRDDAAKQVAVEGIEQFAAHLDPRVSDRERLLNTDILVEERRLADIDDERGVAEREGGVIDNQSGRDPTMIGVVALRDCRRVELR
jgi:hypothetical protein